MATAPSLKSLLVPSKSVEVEFPGMPGFFLDLTFLSRETLQNIRKKSVKTSFGRNRQQPTEELDDKLFLKLYVEAAIKGWRGFKLSYLEQLAPIELNGANPEDELPYSPEEALGLMQASVDFDSFVSDTVNTLSNFTKNSTKK